MTSTIARSRVLLVCVCAPAAATTFAAAARPRMQAPTPVAVRHGETLRPEIALIVDRRDHAVGTSANGASARRDQFDLTGGRLRYGGLPEQESSVTSAPSAARASDDRV